MLANIIEPAQTPHDVGSDLCLNCLPLIILRVPGKNGLKSNLYLLKGISKL